MAQEIITMENAEAALALYSDKVIDPNSVSGLTLAYIGDSVFELNVRVWALSSGACKVGDADRAAKVYSKASSQAKIAELIMDDLSETEIRVYKRGRNAKSISTPHSCSVVEYRVATGLEALMGYLYLKGDILRIHELIDMGIRRFNEISHL